jgi:tRNA uridine 5-carbamoylmethylation protein Kti12
VERNNKRRQENSDCYSDEILQGLMERFEPPQSENRWERPPFVVDES